MNILDKLKEIASAVAVVFQIAKPIIAALRPVLKDVDDACDVIEAKIRQGGVDAARYIVEHVAMIDKLEAMFDTLSDIGSSGKTTCALLKRYAQVETPGVIEPSEVESIVRAVGLLRAATKRGAVALAAADTVLATSGD